MSSSPRCRRRPLHRDFWKTKARVEKLNKGSIFVISAPSGAGKTTICREIMKLRDNLRQSVSFTTRPPREGEVNDTDYTFVSEQEFRGMIGRQEFVEWAEVHGNLYGTSKSRLEGLLAQGYDVILDIDTNGATQIKNIYGEGVFVFILPPSMETLRDRLQNRQSDRVEEIEKRLRRAGDEIRDYSRYDYVIVNDSVDEAVKKLEAIMTAESLRTGKISKDWIRKKFLQ
jgi:guanylate kinase